MREEYLNNLKIIDYEINGCALKLYLGSQDDYWGDDWDDVPFEHNAGPVYDRFVDGVIIIYFPFDDELIEANMNESNSVYCKLDFKENKIPFILMRKENQELIDDTSVEPRYYTLTWFNKEEKVACYPIANFKKQCEHFKDQTLSFNMTVKELKEKLEKLYSITEISECEYVCITQLEALDVK